MSRSYRKNLIYTDGQTKPGSRKLRRRRANRKIRNKKIEEEIKSGGNYKKEYESWNICDFKIEYNLENPLAEPIHKIKNK